MTEREKMLSGALYWAGAPELVQARRRAKELCSRFNQEAVQDPEAGARLLRELLGEAGDDISIQPMFWCDYGCNIRMGSQIEINHNCVILDCAPSIPAARRSRNHLLDASQRERRTMPVRRNRHRNVHQKRQSLPGGQDDEEKGSSDVILYSASSQFST